MGIGPRLLAVCSDGSLGIESWRKTPVAEKADWERMEFEQRDQAKQYREGIRGKKYRSLERNGCRQAALLEDCFWWEARGRRGGGLYGKREPRSLAVVASVDGGSGRILSCRTVDQSMGQWHWPDSVTFPQHSDL